MKIVVNKAIRDRYENVRGVTIDIRFYFLLYYSIKRVINDTHSDVVYLWLIHIIYCKVEVFIKREEVDIWSDIKVLAVR